MKKLGDLEGPGSPRTPWEAATHGCLGGGSSLLACSIFSHWTRWELFEDKDGVFLMRLELGTKELKECFKMHDRADRKREEMLKKQKSNNENNK